MPSQNNVRNPRVGDLHEQRLARARRQGPLQRAAGDNSRRGPQIITKRGVETAVLVPIDRWRRLESLARPNLKELLLAPDARTDTLTPPRREHRRRPVPQLR